MSEVATIEPGIYQNTNEEYHTGPGVSKSGLDVIIDKSPMHYYERIYGEKEETTGRNEVFDFGTAAHKIILEPEDFDSEIAVELKQSDIEGLLVTNDDIKARLKELELKTTGKKEDLVLRLLEADPEAKIWDAVKSDFEKKNGKKTIISAEDHEKVVAMAEMIQNHTIAGNALKEGKAEHSFYWIDEDTGVLCKCRPDYWRETMRLVCDYKTTADAGLDKFQKSIASYNYHRQHAFYIDGISKVTGKPYEDFLFIAQEKVKPYAIAAYVLDETAVARGREEYKKGLELIAECQRTGVWPGYPMQVKTISLPNWKK